MSTTRINSSIYPATIDTDNELLHSIDRSTTISALGLNSLKDSILSIEETLGINPQGSFLSISDRLSKDIFGKFIEKIGDVVTGSLTIRQTSNNTAGTDPTNNAATLAMFNASDITNNYYARNVVSLGNNKAAILFDSGKNLSTGTGSLHSHSLYNRLFFDNTFDLENLDNLFISSGSVKSIQKDNENWKSMYFVKQISQAPSYWGTAMTIVGNSAIDGKTIDFGSDGLQNDFLTHSLRRVRMFDDVETVSNTAIDESKIRTTKLIVDDPSNIDPFGDPDFFNKYSDVSLFVERTLDVQGTLHVRKAVDVLGFRQQRFLYNPDEYEVHQSYEIRKLGNDPGNTVVAAEFDTLASGTKLSEFLFTTPVIENTDFADLSPLSIGDNRLKFNRELIDRNVRATGDPEVWQPFSRYVDIPANSTDPYNFLLVYFGGIMVMRGGLSLYIGTQSNSLKSEIKWPNVHNFNMHDLKMGADLYSMSGQAIIPVGEATTGTSWNGRDRSEISLSNMASFNPAVANTIHIDLSIDDAPRKDREADILVADWNEDLAGRAISDTDLGAFPKRWPYKIHSYWSGPVALPEGSAETRMLAPMRDEIDDMLPHEAYYPYLYVIGVRDTSYELIGSE